MNLNEKRALLRSKHKAVGAKISRIKNNGVRIDPVEHYKQGPLKGQEKPRKAYKPNLSGTEYDPRKPLANVKRMTGKQLDAQIARLDSFLDRGNQFVSDMNNRPIPIKNWRAYKSYENTYNANVLSEFDKVRHITLPNTDQTIDQRMAAKTNPKSRRMNTDGDMTPYKPRALRPEQLHDPQALTSLTKDMKRRARPGYLRGKDRIAKSNLYGQLQTIGSRELYDAIRKLNGTQFRTMFLFSNFGEDFSMVSGRLRELESLAANESPEDRMLDDSSQQQYENALEGMLAVVEWASTIKTTPKPRKPRGGKRGRL